MNEVFKWFERETPPKRPMPPIRRKIPFEHKVLTERDEIWAYNLIDGKPQYIFLYAFAVGEDPYYIKQPYTVAQRKSIERHKRKKP